jgi:hypothetical protein
MWLRSSGILRDVGWRCATDMLGTIYRSHHAVSRSPRRMFVVCCTLEECNDTLYRNVGSQLPTYATRHPGRTKASNIRRQKSETLYCYEVWDREEVTLLATGAVLAFKDSASWSGGAFSEEDVSNSSETIHEHSVAQL